MLVGKCPTGKKYTTKKEGRCTITACSFASVSPGFDVMISVHNVSDGHGELDALFAQDAFDESNLFFQSGRDAVTDGNTMHFSCDLSHCKTYFAHVFLISGLAPGFHFLEQLLKTTIGRGEVKLVLSQCVCDRGVQMRHQVVKRAEGLGDSPKLSHQLLNF